MADSERIEMLEKQVKILNDNFNAFLKMNDIKISYNEADKSAMRQIDEQQSGGISQNSADIDFIAMETGVDLEG